MYFKYYQYQLGKSKLEHGEMHASLHSIKLNEAFLKNENPYASQLLNFLSSGAQPKILKKHLERGINQSDETRTCLITAPDFPLKPFQPSYFNTNHIDLGLSGGDISWYQPNCLHEEYYFFYETRHPFSQWHKSEFVINGLTFNSAEQYMMYGKAELFNDVNIAEKVLKTKNVREQKALGREVKNFDIDLWNKNALDIVFKGNKAKFEQNPEYLDLLLSTKGKTIVEASPTDKVWGIGLTEEDEKSQNVMQWQGTNWLGIVLTELRQEFLENSLVNGYWEKEDHVKFNKI